jgi:hypothetical protein
LVYYNFIQKSDILHIGTSSGAIAINKLNETKTNKELIGYLGTDGNKITSSGSNFGHIIDVNEENRFNYLLSDQYKKLISRHALFNNKLYIINSNKLYVFVKKNYTISHDSLSVRSITPNYIGSYIGIFKNGIKLPFPNYTDGYIRDFNDEAFICYEGLYRDSAGKITIYTSPKDKEVQIGNKLLGSARDIIKIESNMYILLTTKGIYKISFTHNSIETIYQTKSNAEKINFIKTEAANNITTRLFYSVSNKINFYVFQTKENITLFETKNNPISQAYFPNTIDKIYVLLDNRFSEFSLDTKSNNFIENILIPDLRLTHNFLIFNNNVFISTNEGLHIYNLKSNTFLNNVLPIETNNLSLSLINDTVKVGTINGIINLSSQNINNIIKEYIDKSNIPQKKSDNTSTILLIIQSIVILTLIFLIYRFKKTPKTNKEIKNNIILTKENILTFINNNIATVSNKSICDHFNINPVKLYELMEDKKPGEIIREHRVALVRRYRKEKKDEAFIAENTGFSISYLKKVY